MKYTLTTLTFLGLTLLAIPAHGEMFPNGERDSSFDRELSAPSRSSRRRAPTASSEGISQNEFDRKRAAIERYLDQNMGPANRIQRPPARAPRTSGQRYDAEGYRYNRAFSGGEAAPSQYQPQAQAPATEPAPQVYDPAQAPGRFSGRAQRWRVEETTPTYRPSRAPETQSPNYPFENRAPASEFASAFEKRGPSSSRSALLNVKKWMASEEEAISRAELEKENEDPDFSIYQRNARLGLLGGLSSHSTSGAATTGEEAPANIYVGLLADINFSPFIGLEIDGFYGVAPSLTVNNTDGNGQSQSTTTRTLQQMGAQANVKVQYPLPLGSMQLVPKAGIGYGLLSLNAQTATTASSGTTQEENARQMVSGLYWTVGAELVASETISLGIDYASALNASGSIVGTQGGTSVDRPIEGAGYDRFRVGAYFRIAPRLSLGGQFIRRGVNSGSAAAAAFNGTASKQNESLSQILGILTYDL